MFPKIIRWSYYLLFIVVPLIFLPTTSELFEFNKIIVTFLLTSVIVAAWVSRMIIEKRWIFKRSLLDIPILLFLGAHLLSFLFSIDHHVSWYGYYSRWNGGILSLLSYALLYWGFVANMDAKASLVALKTLVGSAILVCLWGVAEHLGVDASWWVQDVQSRVFSTLGQPNWLGAYVSALIFIPLASFAHTKFKVQDTKSIGNLAIFTLLFAVLLFTKSRSGILAFGVASALFWGAAFWHKKSQIIVQAAVFAGLVGLLTVLFPNPVRDILIGSKPVLPPASVGTALEVGGTESGAIRKVVWAGAIRIWQGSTKNFFVGTGPETFAQSYYQYRPIEHNNTSEWELLYNKAHNEFLNYLATTGLLGLTSYLFLLVAMGWVFKTQFAKPGKVESKGIVLALLAGWATISITNFWGFSVVIVQILLFILPALTITLDNPETAHPESKLENGQWIGLVSVGIAVSYVLFTIGRYWYADTKYAAGQKDIKYFQATQNAQYLISAENNMVEAFKLDSAEPAIAADLSNAAAYLSLAVLPQSTDSARQLASLSIAASDRAIRTSPNHPNYYKSRARSLILLSDLDPQFLVLAANALEQAMLISPTDPRLPYNLGVVYKFLSRNDEAKKMFEWSLKLKADFADPKKQLDEMATSSATQPNLQ